MIDKLKELNPGLTFHSTSEATFLPYGRQIKDCDTSELVKIAADIAMPTSGSLYEPGIAALEETALAERIRKKLFGGLDIQTGLCCGYNSELSALEFHCSSEVNIAVTDLVLLLGLVYEMDGGVYDAGRAKAFYVKKGEMIEIYGTTLHFCPCQVSDAGFSSIVCLHKGTNTPLDFEPEDRLLFRKNKWITAHKDNKGLIERGVFGGIYGENYRIRYS